MSAKDKSGSDNHACASLSLSSAALAYHASRATAALPLNHIRSAIANSDLSPPPRTRPRGTRTLEPFCGSCLHRTLAFPDDSDRTCRHPCRRVGRRAQRDPVDRARTRHRPQPVRLGARGGHDRRPGRRAADARGSSRGSPPTGRSPCCGPWCSRSLLPRRRTALWGALAGAGHRRTRPRDRATALPRDRRAAARRAGRRPCGVRRDRGARARTDAPPRRYASVVSGIGVGLIAL